MRAAVGSRQSAVGVRASLLKDIARAAAGLQQAGVSGPYTLYVPPRLARRLRAQGCSLPIVEVVPHA